MDKDPARKQAVIIASEETGDWGYPPFILATAAAGIENLVFVALTVWRLVGARRPCSVEADPEGVLSSAESPDQGGVPVRAPRT